jgi:hypothetical protein
MIFLYFTLYGCIFNSLSKAVSDLIVEKHSRNEFTHSNSLTELYKCNIILNNNGLQFYYKAKLVYSTSLDVPELDIIENIKEILEKIEAKKKEEKSVTTSEKEKKSVTTSEKEGESVTTSEKEGESVTTSEKEGESVTTSEEKGEFDDLVKSYEDENKLYINEVLNVMVGGDINMENICRISDEIIGLISSDNLFSKYFNDIEFGFTSSTIGHEENTKLTCVNEGNLLKYTFHYYRKFDFYSYNFNSTDLDISSYLLRWLISMDEFKLKEEDQVRQFINKIPLLWFGNGASLASKPQSDNHLIKVETDSISIYNSIYRPHERTAVFDSMSDFLREKSDTGASQLSSLILFFLSLSKEVVVECLKNIIKETDSGEFVLLINFLYDIHQIDRNTYLYYNYNLLDIEFYNEDFSNPENHQDLDKVAENFKLDTTGMTLSHLYLVILITDEACNLYKNADKEYEIFSYFDSLKNILNIKEENFPLSYIFCHVFTDVFKFDSDLKNFLNVVPYTLLGHSPINHQLEFVTNKKHSTFGNIDEIESVLNKEGVFRFEKNNLLLSLLN